MEANRRSTRANIGVPPDWFRNSMTWERKRREEQLRREALEEESEGSIGTTVQGGAANGVDSRTSNVNTTEHDNGSTILNIGLAGRRDDDDIRSVKTSTTTASSLRRRKLEADLQEARRLAAIEEERERILQRRLEREENIVKLTAEVERETIAEELSELELSDHGQATFVVAREEENSRPRTNSMEKRQHSEFVDKWVTDQTVNIQERDVITDEDDKTACAFTGNNKTPSVIFEGSHNPPPQVNIPPPQVNYGPPQVNYGPPQVTYGPTQVNYRPLPVNYPPPPVNYPPPLFSYPPPPVNYPPSAADYPHPMYKAAVIQQTRPVESKSIHEVKTLPSSNAKDDISRLAEVLSDAFSSRNKQDPVTIARQTMGKAKFPEFGGDPIEWPAFIAQFDNIVGQCQLTDSEIIFRLRECLKGRARDTVNALLVSPENVDEIITTLKANFGRTDQIIWHMIEKARRTPGPREDDPTSILAFSNVVGNLTATMKTLKSAVHLQNPQLLRELIDKLPTTLKFDWGKFSVSCKGEGVSLDDFSWWLKEVTRVLISTCTLTERPKKKEGSYKVQDNHKRCHNCEIDGHTILDCRKFAKLSEDDRRKLVISKHLCFVCLQTGHGSRECKKSKCSVPGCGLPHHKLLHRNVNKQKVESKPDVKPEVKDEKVLVIAGNSSKLAVLPVIVYNKHGEEIRTYACLDEGTTSTYIEDDLAQKLGLAGPIEPVTVSTLQGDVKDLKTSQRVNFKIKGAYQSARENPMYGARTIDDLGLGEHNLDFENLAKHYTYLDGLPVDSYNHVKPQLLIGQPDKLLTLARKYTHRRRDEPIAYKTWLGWVVWGHYNSDGVKEHSAVIKEVSLESLHDLVQQTWKLESDGVTDCDDKPRSADDMKAIEILKKTTKRIGSEFETGLLWREAKPIMPQSYQYAFHRLKGQERKMDKEPEFERAMLNKLEEYQAKGFIKKLSEREITKDNKEWYLPYFGVYNPNKPGKMRPVFDAAGKSNGVSLNSKLLQGPDYLNPLLSVIWKFRQRRIAFSADITDMYHKIRIIDEDLPAQRFLWRGKDRKREPDVYQINVMIFGASCSPASNQYVKNINAEEFSLEFPGACDAILHNFYMDDYMDSVDDETEAASKISDVIEVNKRGGFVLCKWVSNSKRVLNTIPKELLADGLKELDMQKTVLPTGRALGVWWNAEEDTFCFKTSMHKVPDDIRRGTKLPTKRQALSLIMSIFDPLGMVGHVLIKAKIILQDIWKAGISFDDTIPAALESRWRKWLGELDNLELISIPRCYSINIPVASAVELHVFSDASSKAYASVAYLRVVGVDTIDVSFVAAKTRVAPLTNVTIPRLELMAAVLGSRLAQSIKENHTIGITAVFFYSDSTTVIHWLNSDSKRYRVFVGHRLTEILKITNVNDWYWIPTKENVADDGTRDVEESDVSVSSRWLHGPKFLKETKLPLPFKDIGTKIIEKDLELKREHANLVVSTYKNPLFNFDDYSSYGKLVRVTAWMKRVFQKKERKPEVRSLTVPEIREAEKTLVRIAQKESFNSELECLMNKKPIAKGSKLVGLSPALINETEQIIRVNGRLKRATFLPYDAKFPMILDKKHGLSRLIIGYYHKVCGHQSDKTVANLIKGKFWIPNLGSAVRGFKTKCQLCKNKRAMSAVPEMGDLPKARVTPFVRPFTSTGMDVFGPIDVIVKRSHVKRYGLLFTCLATRAVHVEKLDSLTTDSCIMGIDRFSSVRGRPQEMFCDNGTNSRGAERELAGYLEKEKIVDKMAVRGIAFNFNPPAAPHFGGIWERLVRSIKQAMADTLRNRTLSDEVLQTVLFQAAYMVNCRPLTEMSVDPDDPVALTPNHFLLGPEFKLEEGYLTFRDEDLRLRRHWRFAQRLSDHFWTRWIKEYLPYILRKTKWNLQVKKAAVGDIVIVVDPNLPRNSWTLGKVTAVHPGADGKVRVVDVLTRGSVYRRPVAKIAILDVKKDVDS